MKFLIEEHRERSSIPDYSVAKAASLQALLTRLKAELLAYHPYDGKKTVDGLCNYDYWSLIADGRDVDQVRAVHVYPLGSGTSLPLVKWAREWRQTTDARYAAAREAEERKEYARLHAKYGEKP